MKVCLITDSKKDSSIDAWLSRWSEIIELFNQQLLMVQLREFWLAEIELEEIERLARNLSKICKSRGAKLIINSAAPKSLWSLSDGVHLNDQTVDLLPKVRSEYGDDFLVGYSAHSVEEAIRVVEIYPSVNYLFLAPIFKPISKDADRSPLGLEPLRALCSKVDRPVYALGGVTLQNASECIAAGAYGVAGISIASEVINLS